MEPEIACVRPGHVIISIMNLAVLNKPGKLIGYLSKLLFRYDLIVWGKCKSSECSDIYNKPMFSWLIYNLRVNFKLWENHQLNYEANLGGDVSRQMFE